MEGEGKEIMKKFSFSAFRCQAKHAGAGAIGAIDIARFKMLGWAKARCRGFVNFVFLTKLHRNKSVSLTIEYIGTNFCCPVYSVGLTLST